MSIVSARPSFWRASRALSPGAATLPAAGLRAGTAMRSVAPGRRSGAIQGSVVAHRAGTALRWLGLLLILTVAALTSACGSSSRSFGDIGTGTTTPATVTAISVEPANTSLPRGLTRQFTAIALYSDGTKLDVSSSVNWSSSATTIATVNTTGVVTALNLGVTTVAAAIGTVSGSATLTVSAATLVTIDVTPVSPTIAKGTLQLFTATGIYTDYSTQDISALVTWSSSNPLVATISNAPGSMGLATGVSGGKTTVTAVLGAATGSTVLTVSGATLLSINVTPTTPSIPLGRQQQFTATGVYSDGTQQLLTTVVNWTSSGAAATISNVAGSQGLATAAAVGTATITAAADGLTGSATLTVTAASLLSIAVTPANPTIPKGLTQPFVATGTFSDGTTMVLTSTALWTSATPAVATITNAPQAAGVATGVTAGTSLITATVGAITSPPTTLTVTPAALVSIAVTPVNPTVVNGATLQFTATGTYTDGTMPNITDMVTWMSGTPAVATISNLVGPPDTQGLATAASSGTTLITAAYPGTTIVSPPQTLTVKSAYAYATNFTAGNTLGTVSEYSIGANGELTPLITATAPTGTVTAGINPFAIAITPAATFAYVANSNNNNNPLASTISQYAIGADGSLMPLPVPSVATGNNPNSVTIDPSGTYLYVSNFGEFTGYEYVIGANGMLTTPPVVFPTGSAPASIAINSSNTYAYVANFYGNSVSEYTIGANGALLPIPGPGPNPPGGLSIGGPNFNNPNYVVVDPTGRYVYVANYGGGGGVLEFSIGAGGVLTPLNPALVATGLSPRFIAIDPTGSFAYTADYGSNQVSQFTIVNGILTPMNPAAVTTGVGSFPNGVTIDATGKYLYVAERAVPGAIAQFVIGATGALTPLAPPAPAGAAPTSIATTH